MEEIQKCLIIDTKDKLATFSKEAINLVGLKTIGDVEFDLWVDFHKESEITDSLILILGISSPDSDYLHIELDDCFPRKLVPDVALDIKNLESDDDLIAEIRMAMAMAIVRQSSLGVGRCGDDICFYFDFDQFSTAANCNEEIMKGFFEMVEEDGI